MKLLIDMNLSPRWFQTLSAAGFSAAHWSTLGAATATGPALVTALRQMRNELESGALLTVEPGRTRMSLLPLPSSKP